MIVCTVTVPPCSAVGLSWFTAEGRIHMLCGYSVNSTCLMRGSRIRASCCQVCRITCVEMTGRHGFAQTRAVGADSNCRIMIVKDGIAQAFSIPVNFFLLLPPHTRAPCLGHKELKDLSQLLPYTLESIDGGPGVPMLLRTKRNDLIGQRANKKAGCFLDSFSNFEVSCYPRLDGFLNVLLLEKNLI